MTFSEAVRTAGAKANGWLQVVLILVSVVVVFVTLKNNTERNTDEIKRVEQTTDRALQRLEQEKADRELVVQMQAEILRRLDAIERLVQSRSRP